MIWHSRSNHLQTGRAIRFLISGAPYLPAALRVFRESRPNGRVKGRLALLTESPVNRGRTAEWNHPWRKKPPSSAAQTLQSCGKRHIANTGRVRISHNGKVIY